MCTSVDFAPRCDRGASIGVVEMTDVAKLLYIVVMDDDGEVEKKSKESFRYTRSVLQTTLQLMGCKARHAFKISKRVFDMMRRECPGDAFLLTETDILDSEPLTKKTEENINFASGYLDKVGNNNPVDPMKVGRPKTVPFELYKRRTTVVVKRETFLDVVCDALAEYKYFGPNQRSDLMLACRIREKKESVTVLLCGTSGCGKSTLSALLASRLGITTVVSTDSIRHMMRSFVDEKDNPLLWASTYHAGEYLDQDAVAEAKAKRKAKKLSGVLQTVYKEEFSNGLKAGKSESGLPEGTPDLISPKMMAVEGFKAQSEMVIDSLDRLITAWEERKESVVIEGVHLSLNFVMGLMNKHPSIIPFMIFIAREEKHLERFAVRAKYMTLDPAKNKYVKYIKNIRTIQEYLCQGADKHHVPKVDNTNVDKSVAAIHATVFGCLRRRGAGELLYDATKNTVALINEEYRNQCDANSMSSKGMFQLIQRKGSSRHLMALFNTDGSVAKVWPVDSINNNGQSIESGIGPMYSPLQIDKAELVNLQFGPFGLSAWPSDTGCTSHAGSVDGSRVDGTENGSRYLSSCCSSPKVSDGASKELMDEHSVFSSEEEVDGQPDTDSDDDLSDVEDNKIHEEFEGSVDEETKSDEEYDDLAMQDVQENEADIDEDGKEFNQDLIPDEKYKQNLERFIKTTEALLPETPINLNYIHAFKNEKKSASAGRPRMRKRSQSISAFP